ncbi:hypothetical protein [Streptomyces sp. NPDC059863]|uniref:hypothetical protein n=1 Tax=unclassified Streptomyces TaxID=2593676 RepID=UPI0036584CDC
MDEAAPQLGADAEDEAATEGLCSGPFGGCIRRTVPGLVQPVKHLTALRAADRTLADLLLGSRLVSHSGATIAYVTTAKTTAG